MLKFNRCTIAGLACASMISTASPLLALPLDDHEEEEESTDVIFRVGKNGDVNIKSSVRIGEFVLENGRYSFQHEVKGNDHVFVFTAIVKNKDSESSEPAAIHIKSVNVLRGEKTSSSILLAKQEKDFGYRIVMIEVAGENMEHTF